MSDEEAKAHVAVVAAVTSEPEAQLEALLRLEAQLCEMTSFHAAQVEQKAIEVALRPFAEKAAGKNPPPRWVVRYYKMLKLSPTIAADVRARLSHVSRCVVEKVVALTQLMYYRDAGIPYSPEVISVVLLYLALDQLDQEKAFPVLIKLFKYNRPSSATMPILSATRTAAITTASAVGSATVINNLADGPVHDLEALGHQIDIDAGEQVSFSRDLAASVARIIKAIYKRDPGLAYEGNEVSVALTYLAHFKFDEVRTYETLITVFEEGRHIPELC